VTCPDHETLASYAEAQLEAAEAERLRAHVDTCASCREVLVTLVRSSHPTPGAITESPWDVPVPGTVLGRYRVTGVRGAGGMGVVLSAYDPQLDRQVALKLLRPDGDQSDPERGRQRLVREAQLMARVRHPNVVTVHDVVADEQRVVIAMELVEGLTLREWLEARPRTPAEILAAFRAAGRGLMAAHRAGVVHRDFKPDNVLIDANDHVLVSDFGLAWSHAIARAPSAPQGSAAGLASKATTTVGTPAYMAPEQLSGDRVDASADQFSFCVALFEALCGSRPFEGNTVAELLASMRARRLRPLPRTVPVQVSRALQRGLSLEPNERYPNMKELLERLAPPGRRRAPLVAVAVVLGLAAVAIVGARREASCRPTRQRIEAIWPTERERALAERLGTRITKSRATQASQRMAAVSADLRDGWAEVCASTTAEDAPKKTCLEARIAQAEVVANVVSLPETDARAATTLIARLDDAEGCRNGELLTLIPPPADAASQARIASARLAAMMADGARLSGKADEATAHAERAIELAKTSGWRPVEADALLAKAQVARGRGKFKDAEALLGEALLAAEAGRHFEALARISVQHVLVLGSQTMRPDEAETWVRRAEAALEQLPRPRLRAEVDTATAMLRSAQVDLERGLASSDRALKWTERYDPLSTADLRSMRALMYLQDGQHLRALQEVRVAVSARSEILGPSHPLTIHARLAQGEAEARSGLVADAEKTLTATLDEVRRRSDLNPTNAATGLAALAIALEGRGQPAEALVSATQANELIVSVLGAKHRYAALAERGVGERLRAMGRTEEALSRLRTAIELGSAATSPNHPETLESRASLALTLAMTNAPNARDEAIAALAAARSAPKPAHNALVLSALAVAWTPAATPAERAFAVETARKIRGSPHPDVLRALLLQHRAHDDGAAGPLAKEQFNALQLVDAALAPLELP
jgi:tetratricopeptide (TPR) repeat protein